MDIMVEPVTMPCGHEVNTSYIWFSNGKVV